MEDVVLVFSYLDHTIFTQKESQFVKFVFFLSETLEKIVMIHCSIISKKLTNIVLNLVLEESFS